MIQRSIALIDRWRSRTISHIRPTPEDEVAVPVEAGCQLGAAQAL
jgi:hypothetical protein